MDKNAIAATRIRMTDYKRFEDCLYQFVLMFWGVVVKDPYVDNFHIREICVQLQRWCISIIERREKEEDFILNIAPGETKSLLCSVMFPAWIWTIDPSIRIITGSYTEKLGLDLAVKSKDVIHSNNYKTVFGNKFKIRQDADSKHHFKNNKGGERLVVTVGAFVTGFHAHIKILDDPNNPFEVYNPEIYEKDNLWYDTMFMNRNVSDAMTLEMFVQQRTGTNDLSGYLLSKKDRKFFHLCLPATIEFPISPKHLIQHYTDGVMNPHRKPMAKIISMRNSMDEYSFNAQYGQSPKRSQTKQVERHWFPIITSVASDFWEYPVLYVIDGTMKKGTENDPIGIMPVVLYNYNLYILEFVKKRTGYIGQKELVLETVGKYSGLNANVTLIIEDAAGGSNMIEEFSETLPFNIIAYPKPTLSKPARFGPITPSIKAGKFRLLDESYAGVKWHEDFLTQVVGFPALAHDEEIDCLIMSKEEILDNIAMFEDDGWYHEREFREIG